MFVRTVGSLASTRINAVTPDTLAREVVEIMSRERISCLLVAHQGVPLGIVTEWDLILAASRVIGFVDLQVREIMSAPVLTAAMAAPFAETCRLLLDNEIRHLVLLDNAGDIAGVVTPTDLLRAPEVMCALEDRHVAEAMHREVLTVSPDETVRYTLARMAEDRTGAVIIMEQHRPVGIFTDRDAVRMLAQGPGVCTTPLRKLLRPLVTAPPEMLLAEAVALMQQHGVRKLVVVDAAGQLQGLLSQGSLMPFLTHFCCRAADVGERAYGGCGELWPARP